MGTFNERLSATLAQLMGVIPGLIGAFVVLIIGWMAAKIIRNILEKVLAIIKIDGLSELLNKIEIIKSTELNLRPSRIIAYTVYYVLLLVVVAIAADLLSFEIVSNQIEQLIEYLPSLFSAMLIFLAGLVLANMLKEMLLTSFRSLGIASGSILSAVIFYFLFVTIALSALKQAGIETSFITDNLTIIIAGVVVAFAIGYGFASKEMMSNLLGSLYSRQKFKVGDVIEINQVRGTIIQMDNVSLTLQTLDNRRVVVPLSLLVSEKVEMFGSWNDEDAKLIK